MSPGPCLGGIKILSDLILLSVRQEKSTLSSWVSGVIYLLERKIRLKFTLEIIYRELPLRRREVSDCLIIVCWFSLGTSVML